MPSRMSRLPPPPPPPPPPLPPSPPIEADAEAEAEVETDAAQVGAGAGAGERASRTAPARAQPPLAAPSAPAAPSFGIFLGPMATFPRRSAGGDAPSPRRLAALAPCERSPVFCITTLCSLRTRTRVSSSKQKETPISMLPTPILSAASSLSSGHRFMLSSSLCMSPLLFISSSSMALLYCLSAMRPASLTLPGQKKLCAACWQFDLVACPFKSGRPSWRGGTTTGQVHNGGRRPL